LHTLNIEIICVNSSPPRDRVELANKALKDRLGRSCGTGACTLSRALTLHWDKVLCILKPNEQAKAAVGERVTVVDYPDGRLSIRYRGVKLAYRGFDKLRPVSQAPIVENKRTSSWAPRSSSSARGSSRT
jgi:hypothetical protein